MGDEPSADDPTGTRPPARAGVRPPPVHDTATGVGVFALEGGYPTQLLEVSPRLSDLVDVSARELLGTWPASFGDALRRTGGRLESATPDSTSQRDIQHRDGSAVTVVQHLTLIVPLDGAPAYGAILLFGRVEPLRPWSPAHRDQRSLDGSLAGHASSETVPLAVAVETLGVSASTLRRWSDSGRLRTVRTAGGHRRFVTKDIRRLSLESATWSGPVLRAAPLPTGSITALAALVAEERDALVELAISRLYEPDAKGWYATAPAIDELRQWLGSIGRTAADDHGWGDAMVATQRLSQHAGRRGAGQTEGFVLVERLSELVEFRLRTRSASRSQRVAAHQLLKALNRAFLASHQEA